MRDLASKAPHVKVSTCKIAEKRIIAQRFRERYRTDPRFNILQRVRSAIRKKRRKGDLGSLARMAIKRGGASTKFEMLTGYDIKTLASHIERNFSDGMSWDEFLSGNIHIDHIRPLSSFDLTDPKEVREAWRLDNLQPLWAADNLAKGATYDRKTGSGPPP